MRFGRLLLASLTALAAYSYTQAAPMLRQHESFPRLLQAVVPLFAASVESSSGTPVSKSPAQALLTLDALMLTPLGGSLILVASLIAIDLRTRRHQRALLRC
ncbi:MAG TPA: hypothetical protein VNX18_08320 [Bryobacteraceae bacterium]|jgi:hypothetical protein|nr:hypothetical protein [Bryobacteraceae bacterium]